YRSAPGLVRGTPDRDAASESTGRGGAHDRYAVLAALANGAPPDGEAEDPVPCSWIADAMVGSPGGYGPAGPAGPDEGRSGSAPARTAVTALRTSSAPGGASSRPANSRWPAPTRAGASMSTSAPGAMRPRSRSAER